MFRIVCWQLNEFSKQRSETLHPTAFNCFRCEREEKDLGRGCPRCELMTMQKHYELEIKAQVIRFCGRWPREWSLDALIRLHGDVAALVDSSKRRIKRKWNVRIARLARIYLAEQNQMRMVSDFELLQTIRSNSKPQAAGGVQVTQLVRRQHG